MAAAAEEALVKIGAVLPAEARRRAEAVQIHSLAPQMTDALRARIDDLESAVDRRATLRLNYADAAGTITAREVRPLGLWFWGKVWTLVAWCELRQDFRMFRLDRIVAATETSRRFRPEADKGLATFYRQMKQRRREGQGSTDDR